MSLDTELPKYPCKRFSYVFDMEINDNDSGTIINIAPDGDIILAVGPEKCNIRVHSLILRAASKPFSVMLGLKFKEGRDMIDTEKPVNLPLPEDNAAGLKNICAVAHHQNKMVPKIWRRTTFLGLLPWRTNTTSLMNFDWRAALGFIPAERDLMS